MYTEKHLSPIRGYEALIQKEVDTKNKLIKYCNELNNRVKGFDKTRLEVLLTRFDRQALEQFVSISLSTRGIEVSEAMLVALRYYAERFFRDYVTLEMVDEFRQNVCLRHSIQGDSTVDNIQHYLCCGKLVPAFETYKQASEENKKGAIIYHEPIIH